MFFCLSRKIYCFLVRNVLRKKKNEFFFSLIVSFFFGQTLGIRVYPVCISTKGTTVADGTIAENFNGFFLLFTSLAHWYIKMET